MGSRSRMQSNQPREQTTWEMARACRVSSRAQSPGAAGDARGGGGGKGNGVSNNNTGSNLKKKDSSEVTKLKAELHDARIQLKECHEELAIRKAMIEERDDELARVREEGNKLRAVLSQKNVGGFANGGTAAGGGGGGGGGTKPLEVLLENKRNKKQGVSGESGMQANVSAQDTELKRFPKDAK